MKLDSEEQEILDTFERGEWQPVADQELSMQYMVVIEKGPASYGAYVSDLPGCVAVGESREEVPLRIREAIELHIEGLKEHNLPIPQPASTSELVETRAA